MTESHPRLLASLDEMAVAAQQDPLGVARRAEILARGTSRVRVRRRKRRAMQSALALLLLVPLVFAASQLASRGGTRRTENPGVIASSGELKPWSSSVQLFSSDLSTINRLSFPADEVSAEVWMDDMELLSWLRIAGHESGIYRVDGRVRLTKPLPELELE